jgi:hypothetical protein
VENITGIEEIPGVDPELSEVNFGCVRYVQTEGDMTWTKERGSCTVGNAEGALKCYENLLKKARRE